VEAQTQPVAADSATARGQRLPLALFVVRAFFRTLGAVAPKTAGRLAARMFLKPRRLHTPRRETRWLRRLKRRQFEVEGHSIATYWSGEGKVVLLVHGWEGRGSQMGAFVQPLVDAGFCAVALDLPAHGGSSGEMTDGFTCGRVVAALSKEIGGVHGVVGHSFGGTAVLLAMAGGLEVERAVLISPGVKGDTFFTGYARIVGLPDRGTAELRRVIMARYGHENWGVFTTENLGDVLGRQAGAALVVHDVDDREVAHGESVELARRTRGARMLSTRGAGHRRILRDRQVVRSVVAFMGEGFE
jgi:pimeloyl-ACP methyl ester carboxylesterase